MTGLLGKGHSKEDQSDIGDLEYIRGDIPEDQLYHTRAWYNQDKYIRKGFPLVECFPISLYSTYIIERSLS